MSDRLDLAAWIGLQSLCLSSAKRVPALCSCYYLNYSRVSALAATGACAFDFPPMMFSGDS
jgi:hypothetical protein